MKNVGVLRGAFDPPHIGHLAVANNVLKHCPDIEEVWFTPSFRKNNLAIPTKESYRIEMCKRACASDPRLIVFNYEIENKVIGGDNGLYTSLRWDKTFGKYRFTFIIGQDVLNTYPTWVKGDEVVDRVPYITHPRAGVGAANITPWYLEKPHRVLNLEEDPPEVSSTDARLWLSSLEEEDKFLTDLYVPVAVSKYARRLGFYRRKG